jgi:DNA-binding GntR family transcriptional regulator
MWKDSKLGSARSNIGHDALVAEIRTMIVDGVLPPSSRVPERDLCSRFDISRIPLREVLKVLAGEGHVVLLPNKGARVVKLTTRDVDELYEVTGALESLAGELAVARITDDEPTELKGMHDEMRARHARRDLTAYYALNRRIHETIIVKASGSVVLHGLYEQVSARIRRARFVARMPDNRWDEAMSEHEGIMNALLRRDAATLSIILKQHLRNKSKRVVEAGFAVPANEIEQEHPHTGKRRKAESKKATDVAATIAS